ncbi:helix-turn-helix transcriptional regulator [Pseudokordiimonas caeni]|uniref:helix-turn-helix transcriptional regulator n=1 Tax=Pseudokordiimonas caeni TaxID=2997908 RepID=UPI002811D719|nr:helix-turn-helix domain-containing protein [Pseudokordiimonas caeni]
MADETISQLPSLAELGRQVNARRKAEGLSQKALADIVGCSHVSLIALEKGTGKLRLETAWAILAALGLSST